MARDRIPRDEQARRFQEEVTRRQLRRMRSRRQKRVSVLSGLGMYGVVGWSVAIPTIAGVALGLWIDRRWPSPVSWTLTLLFAGVILGCLNAWYWVSHERDTIEKDRENE